MIFTTRFWRVAIDRAVRTAAQAALLTFGADQAFNAFAADWELCAGMAAGGALLSLLTSIAKTPPEVQQ